MALSDDILQHLTGEGPGAVFTAKDFLDLGSRAAVDQALARLANAGRIRRIDRGVYDLPRVHPLAGPLWPAAERVARAIARQTDSHLKRSGASAANLLGLTPQVPAQAIWLTDGPSRRVRVGKLLVVLQHASRVDMLLPDTAAGMAIVALRHLGSDAASNPDLLRALAGRLDATDRAALVGVRKQLPGWLGVAVGELAGA